MSRWDTEKEILGKVKAGEYRMVRSPKRHRKLLKRGANIWWSNAVDTWLWKPDGVQS